MQNQLQAINSELFGEKASLLVVNPAELHLLKKNARFMKKESFTQLVNNIKKDGRLSGLPLCHRLASGSLEVLSGNHRVQASIEAGLQKIIVMVIEYELTKEEQIAIQLSHNALVGEDDKATLAALWADMETLEAKMYSGLSSDIVESLEKVEMASFTTPPVYTKSVTFMFTEEEYTALQHIMEELSQLPTSTNIYAASMKQWDDFFAAIQQIKSKHEIKNGSLAMIKMLAIVKESMEETI